MLNAEIKEVEVTTGYVDGQYCVIMGDTVVPYWQFVKREKEAVAKKAENTTVMSCHGHDMTCNDIKNNITCHDMSCNDKWKELKPAQYSELITQLEMWGVFAPKAIVKKYGALKCYNAMKTTRFKNPRVPGAYFTKVVRG